MDLDYISETEAVEETVGEFMAGLEEQLAEEEHRRKSARVIHEMLGKRGIAHCHAEPTSKMVIGCSKRYPDTKLYWYCGKTYCGQHAQALSGCTLGYLRPYRPKPSRTPVRRPVAVPTIAPTVPTVTPPVAPIVITPVAPIVITPDDPVVAPVVPPVATPVVPAMTRAVSTREIPLSKGKREAEPMIGIEPKVRRVEPSIVPDYEKMMDRKLDKLTITLADIFSKSMDARMARERENVKEMIQGLIHGDDSDDEEDARYPISDNKPAQPVKKSWLPFRK